MPLSDESLSDHERKLRDLAMEEGRRRERVDQRLGSHEARLNAINGSIDRGNERIGRVEDKLDTLLTEMRTQKELTSAAASKQINSRQWFSGIAIVVFTLFLVIIALLTAIHGGALG